MRTDEALRYIAVCAEHGAAIWTVDGFHVVPQGYMEDHDLAFDPGEGCTPSEGASAAQQFITENGGPDIVWEIWRTDEIPPTSG